MTKMLIIAILLALGAVALIAPKIFEAINFPHDYVEKDEWAVQEWQDLHKVLQAWRG